MYVQTAFRNTSRLLSGSSGYATVYDKAFAQIIEARALHATYSDVFCKLVPFWQLELYFAKAQGYEDFYADVYEAIRTTPNPANNGVAQLNFIKICCDVSKTDLTEFFDAWGMLSPIDVTINDYSTEQMKITQAQIDELKSYAGKYPAPAHKIQNIKDNTLDQFR